MISTWNPNSSDFIIIIFYLFQSEKMLLNSGTGKHTAGPDGQSTTGPIFWVCTPNLEANWERENCNNMLMCGLLQGQERVRMKKKKEKP